MKTKAAVLYKQNEPLKIEELSIPDLREGQVLVKIRFSGVCHSQLNEIKGWKGPDRFLPHTLGHEGSGVVEAVGKGVKKVKPGENVVLTWIKGKGKDVPSTGYLDQYGAKVNSGAISTFMTRTIISENRIVKIDKRMPLMEAALLGCAVPTGAGIVINSAKVKKGTSAAIFGVGGIGMSALIAAKMAGAVVLIAVDVTSGKLNMASKLGATHVIDASTSDPYAEIMNITSSKGVDLAIEASGKISAMEAAFRSVRDNGGLCVLAGNLAHGERISMDPFDLIKGKRIIGTWGGESDPDRDIPEYVKMFLDRKLELSSLISRKFKLEEINDAFDALEKGLVGRAVIEL